MPSPLRVADRVDLVQVGELWGLGLALARDAAVEGDVELASAPVAVAVEAANRLEAALPPRQVGRDAVVVAGRRVHPHLGEVGRVAAGLELR